MREFARISVIALVLCPWSDANAESCSNFSANDSVSLSIVSSDEGHAACSTPFTTDTDSVYFEMEVANPSSVDPGSTDVVWIELTRKTRLHNCYSGVEPSTASWATKVEADDGISVNSESDSDSMVYNGGGCAEGSGAWVAETICIEVENHASLADDLQVIMRGSLGSIGTIGASTECGDHDFFWLEPQLLSDVLLDNQQHPPLIAWGSRTP